MSIAKKSPVWYLVFLASVVAAGVLSFLLCGGIIAFTSLGFLPAAKGWSAAFLLSLADFNVWVLRVWVYTGETIFIEATLPALVVLFFSALFVGSLFTKAWKRNE